MRYHALMLLCLATPLEAQTVASVRVGDEVDVPGGSSDGYGWHRHQLNANGRTYQEYEANGNGGQFVIVVPELDPVVVTTAGNYGQYSIWRRIRDEMVPRDIIGAVIRR